MMQAENTDGETFGKFFKHMLHQGINLAPSKYEAWFLTIAHTEEDIEATLHAVKECIFSTKRRINIHFLCKRGILNNLLLFTFSLKTFTINIFPQISFYFVYFLIQIIVYLFDF